LPIREIKYNLNFTRRKIMRVNSAGTYNQLKTSLSAL
jgi:hypothetical protein